MTPPTLNGCVELYVGETEKIDKCKKRVLRFEQRLFEEEQQVLRAESCTEGGGIWVRTNRSAGCVSRYDVDRMLRGHGRHY